MERLLDDDDDWMYDSYQDHSSLSGIMDTERDSSEEDEAAGEIRSAVSSGAPATAVEDKENKTTIFGITPASRLSLSNQRNKVINVSAVIERNRELSLKVFDLGSKLAAINKELPWLMIEGKDHLAQYIQLKNDNDTLEKRLQAMEENQASVKEDYRLMMEDTVTQNIQLKNDNDTLEKRLQVMEENQASVKEDYRLMMEDTVTQNIQLKNDNDTLEKRLQAMEENQASVKEDYRLMMEDTVTQRKELETGEGGRDADRSMDSDECSFWSERSRVMTWMEDRIGILEADLKKATANAETERASAARAQWSLDELREKMDEKEREWTRRENVPGREINAAGAAEIVNCSHTISLGSEHAKEKLQDARNSCIRLDEKLKGSYALVDEIRLVMGGDVKVDLSERMAALRMKLDASMMDCGETVKAIEVAENSVRMRNAEKSSESRATLAAGDYASTTKRERVMPAEESTSSSSSKKEDKSGSEEKEGDEKIMMEQMKMNKKMRVPNSTWTRFSPLPAPSSDGTTRTSSGI